MLCREVICPVCDHRFMWIDAVASPQPTYYYRNRRTGERVDEAVCPRCSREFIIEKQLVTGVVPDETIYERVGIRGI